jgi:hypothetical protein
MVEDVEINSGTQVVNVGDEEVFLALFNELIKKTRVINRFIQITVTRRIPSL